MSVWKTERRVVLGERRLNRLWGSVGERRGWRVSITSNVPDLFQK